MGCFFTRYILGGDHVCNFLCILSLKYWKPFQTFLFCVQLLSSKSSFYFLLLGLKIFLKIRTFWINFTVYNVHLQFKIILKLPAVVRNNKCWVCWYYRRNVLKYSTFLPMIIPNVMLFFNHQLIPVPFLIVSVSCSNNIRLYNSQLLYTLK